MSLNSIYDGNPDQYDQLRQCWLNTRRKAFIAERLNLYSLQPGSAVLEIGSGTGLLLRELAQQFNQINFHGIEPQQEYVDYSTAHANAANVKFSCVTAEGAHSLFQSQFDVILSNDVLHHVESLEGTVGSLTRLAAPRCRWLAIEPNSLNPYALMGQTFKSGERNFWPSAFLRAATSEGWSLDNRGYIFAIPPFVRDTPAQWLQSVERQVERIPVIGGGVYLEIRR